MSEEIEFNEEAHFQQFVEALKGDLLVENNLLVPPLRLMRIEFTFVDDLGNEVTDAIRHEGFRDNGGDFSE